MRFQDAPGTALSAEPAGTLTPQRSSSSCLRLFASRFNVLIHTKEIIGIVFLFDGHQAFVIIAVTFFDAFPSFVAHQKVYVGAASRVGMNRIEITLCQRNNIQLLQRIIANTDNHPTVTSTQQNTST